MYVCVSKNLKTLQKDGLKADTYATCRFTFMFMCVVLETAVSAIYSAKVRAGVSEISRTWRRSS